MCAFIKRGVDRRLDPESRSHKRLVYIHSRDTAVSALFILHPLIKILSLIFILRTRITGLQLFLLFVFFCRCEYNCLLLHLFTGQSISISWISSWRFRQEPSPSPCPPSKHETQRHASKCDSPFVDFKQTRCELHVSFFFF